MNVAEPVLWSLLFGAAAGDADSRIAVDKLETHVLARHSDGYFYIGKFLAVDYALPRDEAYLVLQAPLYVQRPGTTQSIPMEPGYDRLVLPLGELADIWIFRKEPRARRDGPEAG